MAFLVRGAELEANRILGFNRALKPDTQNTGEEGGFEAICG
jgi:hypothetical protein